MVKYQKNKRMTEMDHTKRAEELFMSGYNCAQSVFGAFSDVMGMDEKTALKISSAFGGGMGRLREVCGTCTGMFMVISVLYGYDTVNDELKKELYRKVQELAGKFKDEYGTIVCRELLKGLAVTSDYVPSPRTAEYYKIRPCVKFVSCAARLTEEFIKTYQI